MSSPLLQPLTVLFVSPRGRPGTGARSLEGIDPAIDVEIVESVAQATTRISAGESEGKGIDAVVCDHCPPEFDGVEFVTAVRERHASLPLVVIPTGDDPECAETALAAGATDVVQTSPDSLSPAVLANRIRQLATIGDAGDGTVTASRPPANHSQDQQAAEGLGSDERFARLYDAIQEFRHAGRKDTVAGIVADATIDILDAPGVGVFLFDDEDNLLCPESITDTMTEYYGGETVFGPGKPDSITWQGFVAGESMLFDDIRTSGIHVNEETAARSSIFVPFGEHGIVVASDDEAGAFSEPSRELLELLAATAEVTLDRVESTAVLRQRERRLRELDNRVQHFNRVTNLIRSVDDALLAAQTREEVESAVLECLVEDEWFDFAWIGTLDAKTGELSPRERTDGGNQYLDELSLDVDACDEPACQTAREWQTTAAPNVAENFDSDGWERAALSQDFHSVLSVPLVYEGVLYGVLTAYADRPDAFQDPVASIIEQIGTSTAYAINATERKFSMLSNGVTELELRIDGADDVLNVIAASVGTEVECLKLTPLSEGSTKILFSAADVSAESVLSATASLVAVDSVTHLASEEDHQFTAVVDGEMVGSMIATAGGAPETIVADGSSLVATVYLPEVIDARTFTDRLERRYPNVRLLSRCQRDQAALTRAGFMHELDDELTARQMEVLRTAFGKGFFDSPRDATGQDVADELDVSQPTVSHHLRAGQGKLFSLLFGEE